MPQINTAFAPDFVTTMRWALDAASDLSIIQPDRSPDRSGLQQLSRAVVTRRLSLDGS